MASDKEPELPRGYLGAQEKFRKFELGVLSHTETKIQMKESDGNELRVKIGYNNPVKTTCSLIEANTKEDRSECVFTHDSPDEHIITYHITVPCAGYWKFQIFALPESDQSSKLAGVFNYLVHCTKATKPAYACPTQFKQWKAGCVLYEPMFLHSPETGPTVRFRLVIPDAKKVVVVIEQEWNYLIPSDGEWIKDVFIGKYYGKNASVTVNALFGEEGGSYSTLLEYII